jgi:hypothetical protein
VWSNFYRWFWLSNAGENKIAKPTQKSLVETDFALAVFKKTASAFLLAVLLYTNPYLQRIPPVRDPFW